MPVGAQRDDRYGKSVQQKSRRLFYGMFVGRIHVPARHTGAVVVLVHVAVATGWWSRWCKGA